MAKKKTFKLKDIAQLVDGEFVIMDCLERAIEYSKYDDEVKEFIDNSDVDYIYASDDGEVLIILDASIYDIDSQQEWNDLPEIEKEWLLEEQYADKEYDAMVDEALLSRQ